MPAAVRSVCPTSPRNFSPVDEETYQYVKGQLSGITTAFLAPIFFASIGLHLEQGAISAVPVFLVTLVFAAFAGKLAGSGLVALACGLPRRDALSVGLAMSARGAVELVIADVALRAGLFTKPEPPPPVIQYMFSSVVVMAILTTVVAPIALRFTLGSKEGDSRSES